MSVESVKLQDLVLEILRSSGKPLSFEELRDALEYQGIYVDGIELRKAVADLIRENIVCKEPSPERRKLLLKLC